MTVAKSSYVPPVATHLITSRVIAQTFQVQVMQPLMHKEVADRFPVLYLTDANLAFDFAKSIAHSLQSIGQVGRFILVGIGYPSDNPFAGDILRCRDLTASSWPEFPDLPRESDIEGVPGIDTREPAWGGAGAFLQFIRHELIPKIDDAYPSIVGDRAYFGHSLGGSFGLHILFNEPDLFTRYALSSPGISHAGDDFYLREAERYIASGRRLDATVFMSVGGEEEFEPLFAKTQMVSSFYRLAGLLQRANIAGLKLLPQVFPSETHLGVWPVAFSHAIQTLFGPAAAA